MKDKRFLTILLTLSLLAVAILPGFLQFYAEPMFKAFLIEVTREEAVTITGHLIPDVSGLMREPAANQGCESHMQGLNQMAADFGLEKIKIYGPAGELICSTSAEDTKSVTSEEVLDLVYKKGQPLPVLKNKGERSMDGVIVDVSVVETYVPVMEDGRTIGAFEVYYDLTTRLNRIRALSRHISFVALFLALGLFLALVMVALMARRSLVARDQAEAALRLSVADKDILIREIHHRTKNSLQVVQSLLYLQSKDIVDDKARAMIEESQNRLQSVSMAHETLSHADSHRHMNCRVYLGQLVEQLSANFGRDGVELKVDIDGIELEAKRAIPCGLLLNELFTNAMKHAFAGRSGGEISISFRQSSPEEITLSVVDNGVGLPEGFDIRNAESLGLQVIDALVRQIDGSLEITSAGGAGFHIRFNTKVNSKTG